MDNNKELEEMRQQWNTLNEKLNKIEANISTEAISKAKTGIQKIKKRTNTIGVLGIIVAPVCYYFYSLGLYLEITIAFALLLLYSSAMMLYCAALLPNISNSAQSILEVDNKLVKFRRLYLGNMLVELVAMIVLIIWCLILGVTFTPVVICGIIGGTIGGCIGVAIDKKTIAMADALREDIQTAKNWKDE